MRGENTKHTHTHTLACPVIPSLRPESLQVVPFDVSRPPSSTLQICASPLSSLAKTPSPYPCCPAPTVKRRYDMRASERAARRRRRTDLGEGRHALCGSVLAVPCHLLLMQPFAVQTHILPYVIEGHVCSWQSRDTYIRSYTAPLTCSMLLPAAAASLPFFPP